MVEDSQYSTAISIKSITIAGFTPAAAALASKPAQQSPAAKAGALELLLRG